MSKTPDLTTLAGIATERADIDRLMRTGKMETERGNALLWSLDQIRETVEALEDERIFSCLRH